PGRLPYLLSSGGPIRFAQGRRRGATQGLQPHRGPGPLFPAPLVRLAPDRRPVGPAGHAGCLGPPALSRAGVVLLPPFPGIPLAPDRLAPLWIPILDPMRFQSASGLPRLVAPGARPAFLELDGRCMHAGLEYLGLDRGPVGALAFPG